MPFLQAPHQIGRREGPFKCSGGTETIVGNTKVHTFLTSDILLSFFFRLCLLWFLDLFIWCHWFLSSFCDVGAYVFVFVIAN